MIYAGAKIQYLCIILRGEALRQLETLHVEVGSTTIENLNPIILGLGTKFSLLMRCQNKSARCAAE